MSTQTDIHELCLEIQTKFSSPSNDATKWTLLKEFLTLINTSDYMSISSDYHFITTLLLDSLRQTLFSELWQTKLYDDIFLQGIPHESFLALVRKLDDSCEGYQQQKILDILQKFLNGTALENLFIYQCSSCGTLDANYVLVSRIWSDLVTFLISLPERVANKTKGENVPKIFKSSCYVPLIVSTIVKVLSTMRDRITKSQNCTLEFFGNVLGRLCIVGYADLLTKKLCVEFIKRCESDFIWRKLSQNMISKMSISSLESFVTHLLLVIPWYGYVDWILGDAAMQTEKLSYLMSVKLITYRHFKQKNILQNIIGHFASSENRQDKFWKIYESLLKNWNNSYNIKYQCHDQQIYIAVALMICCGWLKVIKDYTKAKNYLSDVLGGTEVRIGSPSTLIRTIGMVVSSELLNTMKSEAEKLSFEELGDEKIAEYLRSFIEIPQSPKKDTIFYEEDLKCFNEIESPSNKSADKNLTAKETKQLNNMLLNESDDDLEPYTERNYSFLKKPNHPVYLNDCLQVLIEQENEEWFEQCLLHAEELINNNSDTIHQHAEEMTKVLLHIDCKYSIDNFEDLRMQILVALVVKCPLPVVKYLTIQFYEPNYNIKQRLDILEVLAKSSLRLSRPDATFIVTKKHKSGEPFSSKEAWKTIVEERIAAKSRYITKGPQNPVSEPFENLFAPIAGFFFYPLIHNYYKKGKVLKFFGEDSYVLGRLICTLGTIMHAAYNSPHAAEMGEVFLEYLSSVWNHEETSVREAILLALVTIYASVPSFLLLAPESNIQVAVYKSYDWLQSVISNDLDINCQVKASFALGFLMNVIKEELPTIPGFLDT